MSWNDFTTYMNDKPTNRVVEMCVILYPKGHDDENGAGIKIKIYKDVISDCAKLLRWEVSAESRDKYEKLRMLYSAKISVYIFMEWLRNRWRNDSDWKENMPNETDDWMIYMYDRARDYDWFDEFEHEDTTLSQSTHITFRVCSIVYPNVIDKMTEAREKVRKEAANPFPFEYKTGIGE